MDNQQKNGNDFDAIANYISCVIFFFLSLSPMAVNINDLYPFYGTQSQSIRLQF